MAAVTILNQQQTTRAREARWLLSTLLLLFFLSGISALIYQVLWLRLLSLVFGVTIWAASTVLASFMTGLALGSFAAGRVADRARNPLILFGFVEGLAGLSALASPLALSAVERLYVELHPTLSEAPWALTAVRFVLSFAVLVVPTTLMGATLPLVVKSSLMRGGGLGERLSLLYGTNTAGAIAGTLLAGFYLIGSIGIGSSFQLAAAINLTVGLLAATVSLLLRRDGVVAREDAVALSEPDHPSTDGVVTEQSRRVVLVVFTLSGFASLGQEVIWFRLLILFQAVTTYAFAVMLATFLAGIAIGSYLITPLLQRRLNWLLILAIIEMGIGVVSLLSLTALTGMFGLVGQVEKWLARPLAGTLVLLPFASFLAVFPATLLMGIAFPIGMRLWTGVDAAPSGRTGQRIGVFYSLNVLGALLGALAAGFLLLPQVGSQVSLILVAAVSLMGGAALLAVLPQKRRALALSTLGLLLFVTAAATIPNPFAAVLNVRHPGERALWREEGPQTTVSIQETSQGTRIMYLDGWPQASDDPLMLYGHRRIGHLPMVLHQNPKEALVIGLGGGATTDAVSQHPRVQVEVIELSSNVVRGSDSFRHINGDVLDRSNVSLHIDDGRNYLALTRKRYDVLTADIVWPHHAGAGNLYSAEYFRLARNVLADDGVMLQWVPGLPETMYKIVVRTFLSVFPETTLWLHGSIMIGAKQPLQLSRANFKSRMQDPKWREALASIGITSFESLLDLYWAGPEEIRQFVGPGPLQTDDRPMLEYYLSLPRGESPPDLSTVRGNPSRYVIP